MQFLKKLENVRKYADIKLVTTERRRGSYCTTKFFTENLLAIEMTKTEILTNKLIHSGLSLLEFSKMLM